MDVKQNPTNRERESTERERKREGDSWAEVGDRGNVRGGEEREGESRESMPNVRFAPQS